MPLAYQTQERIQKVPRQHNDIGRNGADSSNVGSVFRRFAFPILTTYVFLPLAFLIPGLDSTPEPYFDLDSWFALRVYDITETGGPAGASILGILMIVLLVTRAGISMTRRFIETGAIFCFVAILAGGGVALNEYVIKPIFEIPRPNIVYLAGIDGSGPLGMPAREFYALDQDTRKKHLRTILEAEPRVLPLHELIREHWIASTGYSFPSGHAFTAMFFATFFYAMGATWLSIPRLLFSYFLLPWVVCVCYSRIILRMHTAADVAVGALAGLLFGVLAFALVRASITASMRRTSAQIDKPKLGYS
ncbi:MAG: phosphatase PAP2 family protein [bacterium]